MLLLFVGSGFTDKIQEDFMGLVLVELQALLAALSLLSDSPAELLLLAPLPLLLVPLLLDGSMSLLSLLCRLHL